MTDEMYKTLDNMERLGGSFVKRLAALYWAADRTNKAKIEAAFPEYFEIYHPDYRGIKETQDAD